MFDGLSQLMNDKAKEATSEKMMKMMTGHKTEMNQIMDDMNQRLQNLIPDVNDIKIQLSNQQPIIKLHHVDISTDGYDVA